MLKRKLFSFALIIGLATTAFANDCSFTIKTTDMMTGVDMNGNRVKSITIPATCQYFTIHMWHIGKMPKTAMGHNIVIAKTTEINRIVKDGVRYGIKSDYIKPGDERVLVASPMIGGGEKTFVRFSVDKIKKDDYSFFCSFLGHDRKMRGKLVVQ